MSVYVDELFKFPGRDAEARRVGARDGHRWCHMWADTEKELHEMAGAIGMRREWFQNKPRFPHYDLVPTRRARAVKRGAIVMSLREWFRKKRLEGKS